MTHDKKTEPELVINSGDNYATGCLFFYVLTKRLDETLSRELGPTFTKEKRRDLCSLITQQIARLLDGGWFDDGDSRMQPLLGFAERHYSENMRDDYLKKLIIPLLTTEFQEGADYGAILSYFDDESDIVDESEFTWGVLGEIDNDNDSAQDTG